MNSPGTTLRVGWRRWLGTEYLVFVLSAVYFLCLWPFAEGLGTAANLGNVLASLLPLFIVSIGQTFVLITGGIDLSVVSIMGLSSVAGGFMMSSQRGFLADNPVAWLAGIVAMLGVGLVAGLVNGWVIARLKMPPFIVTLTTMMFGSGLAVWLTQSQKIGGLPATFTWLGKNVGITLAITVVLASLAQVGLNRSYWGRWLYAVGHNRGAALVSGVPVSRVIIVAYGISGFLSATAAIIYSGRLETADPRLVERLLLDVVGATVIGGTSLFGGRGKVMWTLAGVLFMTLIDNSLNLIGYSHFVIMMIKGGVILAAALIDSLKTQWAKSNR
jgi:ribose/xylose/arabinose/galactoside ABC-type transport system permease subunit